MYPGLSLLRQSIDTVLLAETSVEGDNDGDEHDNHPRKEIEKKVVTFIL